MSNKRDGQKQGQANPRPQPAERPIPKIWEQVTPKERPAPSRPPPKKGN